MLREQRIHGGSLLNFGECTDWRNNWSLEVSVTITSFPTAERLLVIPEILAGEVGIVSKPL
jgi:hypothetical protein